MFTSFHGVVTGAVVGTFSGRTLSNVHSAPRGSVMFVFSSDTLSTSTHTSSDLKYTVTLTAFQPPGACAGFAAAAGYARANSGLDYA